MGPRTVTVVVRDAPGATSPGPSGLRSPSHTTIAPCTVYQWYEMATSPRAGPVAGGANGFHVSVPVLVRVIGTTTSVPAPIVAGGAALYEAESGAACADGAAAGAASAVALCARNAAMRAAAKDLRRSDPFLRPSFPAIKPTSPRSAVGGSSLTPAADDGVVRSTNGIRPS